MGGDGWRLEVVRGREAGRAYPLGRGETVLGNALNGGPGLDLAHQEGDSPRRMAARQAQLDLSARGLTVSDLDSPGGTFVNRQRLLPGQARSLQPGDLIQLGGVQLKVVAGASPSGSPAAGTAPAPRPPSHPSPAPASPPPPPTRVPDRSKGGPLTAAFTLATGARCRTWDDFLTISAQRWPALRDELVSGRLAAFLTSIGRGDMAPSAEAPGTPDERLDAWLSALPTTRPGLPEIEVQPASLRIRAVPGGGMSRTSLRITNTGYRLLKTRVRVEPVEVSWVKIPGEFARGPVVTVDQTELPIEVHIPETFDESPGAWLVFDSNGGTRRVAIGLERPASADAIPEASDEPGVHVGLGPRDLIARQPIAFRLVTWGAGALLLRVLVLVAGLIPGMGPERTSPPLRGVSVLLACLGCGAAIGFALKHGEPRDVPTSGFAGGIAGVIAAAILVAACRTIEPMMGTRPAASPIAVCLLWAMLGAGLAALSAIVAPPHTDAEGSS